MDEEPTYRHVKESLINATSKDIDQFIEKNKDPWIDRNFAFVKIKEKIENEISSITSKGSQVCPFIRALSEEFKKRETWGIKKEYQLDYFFQERLPDIKSSHQAKAAQLPSDYPFPDLLEASNDDIIQMVYRIQILYEILNGEYDRELGFNDPTSPQNKRRPLKKEPLSTILKREEDLDKIVEIGKELGFIQDRNTFSNLPGNRVQLSALIRYLHSITGYFEKFNWSELAKAFTNQFSGYEIKESGLRRKAKKDDELYEKFKVVFPNKS